VVAIDKRGIRPKATLPPRDCRTAFALALQAARTSILRSGGVAGAAAVLPARLRPASKAAERPSESSGTIFSSVGESRLLVAVLLALLVVAAVLLGLASVEPGWAAVRFRAVRVVERHRPEIAASGFILLAATAVLFFLAHPL
jgi:hypothetical protein